jgi:hypothetical protein
MGQMQTALVLDVMLVQLWQQAHLHLHHQLERW